MPHRSPRASDFNAGNPLWLRPALEALTAITTSAAPLENKLQSACTTLMDEAGAAAVLVLDTTGVESTILCSKSAALSQAPAGAAPGVFWPSGGSAPSPDLMRSLASMTLRSHLSHTIQIDRNFLVGQHRLIVACCPMVSHGRSIGSLVCAFSADCAKSDVELNQLRVCARVLAMAIGSSSEHRAALQESQWERRYAALTQALPGATMILSTKGDASLEQQGADVLPGFGELGRGLASSGGSEHTRRQLEAFRQAVAGNVAKCHFNVHGASGSRILEHRYVPVPDQRGVTSEVALFARDVTEMVMMKQSLRDLTERDALTGTLTMQALMQRAEDWLSARGAASVEGCGSSGDETSLVFMSIEVDGSATGIHLIGNEGYEELLQSIVGRICISLPGVDTIARRGERNFVALFEAKDHRREAAEVASRIIAQLREPISAGRKEHAMSVTIGYCASPADGLLAPDLFRNADIAAAIALRSGRNCALPFRDEMAREADDRTQLETRLYRAVENEEFELAFQPKIRIRDGALVGVEALLRWQGKNAIGPGRFIPVAEECGLISFIGEWALRQACKTARRWADQGMRIPISVNVSTRQFHDNDFHNVVAAILSQTQCDPALIDLEVTEGVMFSDPEAAIVSFTLLKDMGVSISIDDFGMGFSSLSYLKSLPADAVKIDRTFIDGLPHDLDNAAIAKAIIAMAKAMNMTVVAEGVEQQECLGYLDSLGCDEAQGYYFSKPLFEPEFMQWLLRYEQEGGPVGAPRSGVALSAAA